MRACSMQNSTTTTNNGASTPAAAGRQLNLRSPFTTRNILVDGPARRGSCGDQSRSERVRVVRFFSWTLAGKN